MLTFSPAYGVASGNRLRRWNSNRITTLRFWVHIARAPPAATMAARGARRWVLRHSNYTQTETKKIHDLFDIVKNPSVWKVVKRIQIGFEIGEDSGTPHLQGFVHFKNSKTRSALDKWFGFHWHNSDPAHGTDFENWNYTAKEENLLELGLPEDRIPREEGEPDIWERIVMLIDDGMTTNDIIRKFPSTALRCIQAIERYRLDVDLQAAGWRDVKTTYITGETGAGKTRYVMEKYGYGNVYRILNKKHPWDGYRGQDVVVFEEFRNTHKIEDMLNWLDGYPAQLPARYTDKLAHFTKVYIISNWEYEMQYSNQKLQYPKTYAAWDRRIDDHMTIEKTIDSPPTGQKNLKLYFAPDES